MDALSAAAEAARAASEETEVPLDPDDATRNVLPSDDEEGPEEKDDETDAAPPGGADEMDEDDAGGAAPADAPAPATAPATATAPQLPVDVGTCKVAELKEHLKWRAQPQSGLKPELLARLRQAIADNVPVLTGDQLYGQGGAPPAAEPRMPQWEPIDASKINRPVYTGSDKFIPNPDLKWTSRTHPFDYMNGFYPVSMRTTEVENSKRYRGWLKCMLDLDLYAGQPDISPRTNSLAHALLLLQGLNPVPDQRRMFTHSFAYKDHRGGDLMTREDWKTWKALFHISHPGHAPKYGTKEWDELHKVRPMLDEYLRNCVNNVSGGRKFSIDEITIGFQGHHARLKLRCGKFKRAGDGFQADAIVLAGGYVLFLVFRGDNTVPVYKKEFSPLHNRCLVLLSKLLAPGHEGYWDNLYPSRDVAQEVATGGRYTAEIPAGSEAGKQSTITVPPTGTCGTARANRGIDPACKQPNPKTDKLSKSIIDEIKAKPVEERVKSSMSVSEPRVLCVSVFDNGPVHMLDTIHTSAGIITILKPRWDAATKTKVKLPLRILAIIDEYNHGMNNVDRRDHLSHEYNLDGGFWRDKKWWVPIFKELFKSSCDQGYVVYKRVCEIEEEARVKRVLTEKEAAAKKARDAARAAGTTDADEIKAVEALAVAGVKEGSKIKAMEHLEFLEKIAEGFVIEAYNSTTEKGYGTKPAAKQMNLYSYDLPQLERALDEMRGKAPPSDGARQATTPQTNAGKGGSAAKRKFDVYVEDDGRIAAKDLCWDCDDETNPPHALVNGKDAVRMGLITETYRASMFCSYRFCPIAAENAKKKCGEGCKREQAPRAKAPAFCIHPKCKRAFHEKCWCIMHRLMEP